MKRLRWSIVAVAGAALALALGPRVLHAEEYAFDVSETEKKPYRLGGFVEFRPALSWLDQDAAMYQLRFYDRREGRTLPEYHATLQLEGSLEKGWATLFVRMNTGYHDTYLGSDLTATAYEASLSLRPAPSLAIVAGKRTFKWGKGNAWNPVAFVDRPKNPDDPGLDLEGYVAASADYIKSFNGPLKTLSFTPVLLPVSEQVNDDFGEAGHANLAGKIYLLLYDTDLDILLLSGGSRTFRYGLDFSRNIATNVEVHGEYAHISDVRQSVVGSDGSAQATVRDAASWLLGLRYLSARDTTLLLEFYRNGNGYTERQMADYFAFVNRAYATRVSSGSDALLRKAASVTEGYGRPNAGRSYAYLRVSQKEPFDILYWTPAVTAIVNAEDESCSLSPEITYTGITNVELRLKGTILAGSRLSEYGEKQNNLRIELLARYFF